MKAMLNYLTSFIAPDICPICQKELVNPDVLVCNKCFQELPKLPQKRCPACGGPADPIFDACRKCLAKDEPPWQVAVAAFPFEGSVRIALHQFKFRNRLCLAKFFAKHMADAWNAYADDFEPDVVTAVPLHWKRRLKRGYNQSHELARQLAKYLNIPCKALLTKTVSTKAQATLSAKGRQQNLKKAFHARNSARKQRIILVDDIFTTGSTLTAATKALLKQQARAVAVITAARDL